MRVQSREMEFVWRPFNESYGSRAEIFTHLTYYHYQTPPTFEFWQQSTDEAIVDDPELETYNIERRSKVLYDYLIHMADHYRGNDLLVLLGGDFVFQNSQKVFMNYDKLIKYINANYPDINLFYSTPNDYFEALKESDIKWPTKYDDFLPYADRPNLVWSGYYTSRPTLKGQVREASSEFISHSFCLAVDYLANGVETYSAFKLLNDEMGVLQHHDAVSGTEKQHVADDYRYRIGKVLDAEGKQFLDSFKRVSATPLDNLAMCKAHNSTFKDCPTNILDDPDIKELGVHIANPTTQREVIAKIPIPHSRIELYNENETMIMSDIICAKNSKEGRILTKDHDEDGCHIYFKLDVGAFGGQVFILKQTSLPNHIKPLRNKGRINTKDYIAKISHLRNECVLDFDRNDLSENQKVKLEYMYYTSFIMPYTPYDEGAYLFRPLWPTKQASNYNRFKFYESFEGKVVKQFRLYGDQVDTILTGHDLTDFLEIETQMHGINWDPLGKSVVMRITNKNIESNGIWYTDSMCMEMMKRVKDYRPTYHLILHEPIALNFYPVGHGIYIKDDETTLELLNDRAQSGSSMNNGSVEVMLQRKLYGDDKKGLDEPLNERVSDGMFSKGIPVTTKHYFRFFNNTLPKEGKDNSRFMQKQIDSPLLYIFGNFTSEINANSPSFYNDKSPVKLDLPDEIKIIMQPQIDGKIFIRLENIMDPFSSSYNYTVNVQDLAKKIATMTSRKFKSVYETSLTRIYSMDDMKKKFRWKTLDFDTEDPDYSSDVKNIELTPQRIRSFVIDFGSRREDEFQYDSL